MLDVIQGFLYEKSKWTAICQTRKEPANSMISEIETGKIQRIYKATGIETVRKDKIKNKLLKAYNSRLTLFQNFKIEATFIIILEKKRLFSNRACKIYPK